MSTFANIANMPDKFYLVFFFHCVGAIVALLLIVLSFLFFRVHPRKTLRPNKIDKEINEIILNEEAAKFIKSAVLVKDGKTRRIIIVPNDEVYYLDVSIVGFRRKKDGENYKVVCNKNCQISFVKKEDQKDADIEIMPLTNYVSLYVNKVNDSPYKFHNLYQKTKKSVAIGSLLLSLGISVFCGSFLLALCEYLATSSNSNVQDKINNQYSLVVSIFSIACFAILWVTINFGLNSKFNRFYAGGYVDDRD